MALIETVRAERLKKIERIKEVGMEAYPSRTARTHTVNQFLDNHETLLKNSEEVILAGRVMSIREHGGSLFVDIFDGTVKAQIYFQKENLEEKLFDQFVLQILILAGRVMSIREHGGSLFVDIFDGTVKAQIYFQKENLEEKLFDQFVL